MSNIKFRYVYRDGSNFKKRGEIVFANPENLASDEVSRALQDEWGEDGLFLAHQIRIPEVFLYGKGDANADDHCFHELAGVEPTQEMETDGHGRTISQFVREIQRARGMWEVFDPFDRWLRGGPCLPR